MAALALFPRVRSTFVLLLAMCLIARHLILTFTLVFTNFAKIKRRDIHLLVLAFANILVTHEDTI